MATEASVRDPKISVIVPVWNGAAEIELLLEAIDRQTVDPAVFEIIVVDNGSTDESPDIVRAYGAARLVREMRPGSYAARNHAIALARAPFLLFTDADCVPEPDWIERALERSTSEGDNALVGGRIDLFRSGAAGPFASRYDELVAGFNQSWNLDNRICVTANWLASKELMVRVGMFDASLLSGGDGECAGRIADTGARLVYAPEMVIRHPTRANLGALIRKKRRVLGGRWQKDGDRPSFIEFSKRNLREYLDQARWMKNSQIGTPYKPGVLMVVASLWAATQCELVRLAAGGRPYRD